jgi:arylsulfatase A-like enzyme
LIRDLDRNGLLDSTLVMITSEFGRTPKINGTAGRDHWPKVFSIVLAGGGIKKGSVYGSSDATASEPENDPLTVEDWAMTVYNLLGIDGTKKLMSPGDRPIDIVREGHVRKELLA